MRKNSLQHIFHQSSRFVVYTRKPQHITIYIYVKYKQKQIF